MTAPLIDIVVLVHDCPEWADLCIRAVEHHTRNPYRLVLVDNASVQEKTKQMLRDAEARGHTVVRLPENKSFSNGVNAGVAAGTSQVVCVLNDDAIVTEGWEGHLLQDVLGDKNVGLTGAQSNFASGAQMDPGFIGDPPYLVFVCVAFRREVWNKVGPMDEENFDGFSGEDLDYSWRVLKAGLRLKVSKAWVYHAGSRTLGQTVGSIEARQKNDAKYARVLEEKHGKEWITAHSKLKQRVLVCSYHAEDHTRVEFLKDLQNLRNTAGYEYSYLQIRRLLTPLARAAACDYALDNGFDVLVQLDDDAQFEPDTVRRLLNGLGSKRDIVCALAYQRKPPHLPCIFEVGPDGMLGRVLEGWENTGLRKVDVSGYHCSAMRTSVIKRLRDGLKDAEGKVLVPGIEKHYWGGFENKVGEDFAFSINCKKIGIQVWCDTDLIAGHWGAEINVNQQFKAEYAAGRRG